MAPSTRYSTGCATRSEEHTSELQSRPHLVCRLLLEKKKNPQPTNSSNEKITTSPINRLINSSIHQFIYSLVHKFINIPFHPFINSSFFFLMIRRPPRSTLFPYTTSSD